MEALNNLAKIGQLHFEAADADEFDGLLQSARDRLRDIRQSKLSDASQFDLAYNAAHALALAALRRHGYRPDNRYQAFQCLVHTVGFSAEKTQFFVHCHNRRNAAEYEGRLEIDETLLGEFIEYANELLILVEAMDPIA